MIRIIATFPVREEGLERAMEIGREMVAETRREQGCIQYNLLQSKEDAARLVIVEAWATQADLDAHSASAHFTRLVPELRGLCGPGAGVELFTQLA